MNKYRKISIISISFLFILTSLFGGIYMLHKNKKEHYVNVQKKRIDLFFEANVNNYNSMKITKTEKDPMGGYSIEGYINNNKKLRFIVISNQTTNFQFDDLITYSDSLDKMFKKHRTKDKFPSEIIKEKHLNKEDYEADPPRFF